MNELTYNFICSYKEVFRSSPKPRTGLKTGILRKTYRKNSEKALDYWQDYIWGEITEILGNSSFKRISGNFCEVSAKKKVKSQNLKTLRWILECAISEKKLRTLTTEGEGNDFREDRED